VVTRDVFGRLDVDGDGKISATEAGVDASFDFAAMDSDGDGFVTDAEYRTWAKADMPKQR
jgi:Ca2+-binding EF-hand superfamily protein